MTQWFADKVLCLPELASSNGRAVDDLMVYVHWLMFALFIGWIIYFFYALHRFQARRNPKADYVGVRGHASNYLEVAVAAIEALLLIAIAVPVWSKNVAQFPPAGESTVVQLASPRIIYGADVQNNRGQKGKYGFYADGTLAEKPSWGQ